jgi:hypothetical protein
VKSNLVDRLLAVRAEIVVLLARLSGRAPDPGLSPNVPEPAPFQPAAGMRRPARPGAPLDVRGRAA